MIAPVAQKHLLQRIDRRGGSDSKSAQAAIGAKASQEDQDDLFRPVFGVLGIPLDALDLDALLGRIDAAMVIRKPFLLSTPNVNFLMLSRADREFRESLLFSDACPIDGMPLVWIARLLGIRVPGRLSGSDIFDALKSRGPLTDRWKVFLFGGSDGVAEKVRQSINAAKGGMTCVGTLNPGFGSVADMSSEAILHRVNASQADFLSVFLSAQKAQSWLLQNHHRLEIPFRAQLGATINLQAGIVQRAPRFVQRHGFEWLWRIKEEPYLWRRYFDDGRKLFYLFVICVLPLSVRQLLRSMIRKDKRESLVIEQTEEPEAMRIKLSGAATARHIDAAIACFQQAVADKKNIVIDVSDISTIDPRFFGLLLMLRKLLLHENGRLSFAPITRRTKRIFGRNGFEYLLDSEADHAPHPEASQFEASQFRDRQ
jgi:N-acetylglucosaminyldiphosphoundecaprenol N-acetyl-beta-D-mannosaminyltransferase